MTETIKNNIEKVNGMEHQLIYALLTLCAIVGLMYGYFVRDAVMNVVERERMSKETRVVMSQISDLETSYLQATNSITLQFAYDRGFKDAPKADYISLKASSNGLSMNTRGN